jgi:lysophospholipase L1-like esterase
MRRIVFVLLSLLALSACGGGSAGACRDPVRVDLGGDSIMCGRDGAKASTIACGRPGGDLSRVLSPPSALLQMELDRLRGTGRTVVTASAIGGTTAHDRLVGDGVNAPWPQGIEADLELINYGINEAAKGRAPADYSADLRALLQLTPAATEVLLVTPTPVAQPWPVTDMAQAMRAVAAQEGATVIDANTWAGSAWVARLPDGVHPTQEGYQAYVHDLLAPAVLGAIERRCGS